MRWLEPARATTSRASSPRDRASAAGGSAARGRRSQVGQLVEHPGTPEARASRAQPGESARQSGSASPNRQPLGHGLGEVRRWTSPADWSARYRVPRRLDHSSNRRVFADPPPAIDAASPPPPEASRSSRSISAVRLRKNINAEQQMLRRIICPLGAAPTTAPATSHPPRSAAIASTSRIN